MRNRNRGHLNARQLNVLNMGRQARGLEPLKSVQPVRPVPMSEPNRESLPEQGPAQVRVEFQWLVKGDVVRHRTGDGVLYFEVKTDPEEEDDFRHWEVWAAELDEDGKPGTWQRWSELPNRPVTVIR